MLVIFSSIDIFVSTFKNYITKAKYIFNSECPKRVNPDEPEDVLGGLEATIGLNWNKDHQNHIIVHMADAAAHGKNTKERIVIPFLYHRFTTMLTFYCSIVY